ncbi:uncharacterized protein PV09_09337 [Verruconis gallopava]|uniref:Uncharacterized protein n=1 Tax=Verruconis gallopava TaxID=253628 RepID=A0A0D1X9M7_9PEZI|nr:uncharacterized protein PV09_09337 [Verruconis gallopava]KIV98890.1 hypothetical protein PV09_09337 [Verruconis gallopava]
MLITGQSNTNSYPPENTNMDDQIRTALELVSEIIQSALFFIFVYGVKAIKFIANVADKAKADENWLTRLAITCFIILISLQAIRMAYRGVMFWIRFFFKFAVSLGSIAVMVWLWSRGFDGAWEDLLILADFWTEQYQQMQNQAKANRALYELLQSTRDAFVSERQRMERMQVGRP